MNLGGGYALSLFPIIFHSALLVSSQKILYENDSCPGGNGICRTLENCPSARDDLRKGLRPQICSFQGDKPIVCCRLQSQPISQTPRPTPRPTAGTPPTPRPTTRPQTQPNGPGAKARAKCQEYAKTVKRVEEAPSNLPGLAPEFITVDYCGQIEEPLIVGGVNARPREFPHMVLIGYGDEPRIKYLCGGSLVSEKYVLSAAHCSNPGTQWGPAKWAKVGDLDTESNFEEAKPEVVRIARRIDHNEYRKDMHYNDIALYQLERPVEINEYVRPICLHTGERINDKTALATGWGHTEFAGRSSKDLKKVRVQIVDIPTCNRTYRNNIGKSLPYGIVEESQMCAGEVGKDSCQGDSGGPLQVPLKDPYCMYLQIGITSFGKSCGSNPGVYTRVSNYIQWIESIVWP